MIKRIRVTARLADVTVTKRLKLVCKKSGVLYGDRALDSKGHKAGISWHSFRVTRVTRWIQKGLSDELIRRASGHQTLESYKRYENPKKACDHVIG